MDSLNIDELRAAGLATRDEQRGCEHPPRRASLLGHLQHWVLGLASAAVLFVAY